MFLNISTVKSDVYAKNGDIWYDKQNKVFKAKSNNVVFVIGSGGDVPTFDVTLNYIAKANASGSLVSSQIIDDDTNVGIGKTPTEKLDVNGNVNALSYKFQLQATITPMSNMLVSKTDGSRPVWYDNNSVAHEIALADDTAVSTVNIKRNLTSGNFNYCGFAPFGSAENAAVWTVTKITVASNGTITKQIFNNITWSSVPF